MGLVRLGPGRQLALGLGLKFTLFVSGLLLIFTVSLTTVNFFMGHALIKERLRERAESMATMLAEFASTYLYADLRIDELTVILGDLLRQKGVTYAFVLDPEGALLADGADDIDRLFEPTDDPLSEEARASGQGRTLIDDEGVHAVQPVYLGYERLGTARVGLSLDKMRDDIAALRNQNLALGLIFLVLSVLISVPLVRRITRPLAQLTESTEAASKGQFDRRITISTNDELEVLAGAFNRMLTQLQHHNEQIRHLAFFDSITDLPNRVFFKELLSRAMLSARRYRRRGAVLFLDIDRFKLINDTFGHDAGDRLLQGFAQRLAMCLRESDIVARLGDEPAATVARLGGDEFTIMLPEIESPDDATRVAERVLQVLDQPFDLGNQSVVIGSSIGLALFPDDGDDPESLLKNADVAMYHAKEQGRNNVQFYRKGLSARNLQRITLERELRIALEQRQFLLHYQPLIDLRSCQVVGFEALLRWQHPQRGLVAPSLFVPLAEETRLIMPIGDWVIREACAQAQLWAHAGFQPFRVSVNLSASQLQQENFVDLLAEALAGSGASSELLELEITETMMMVDPEDTAVKLNAMRRLGVTLAIDDFGTGHSSLSYLKRFPLNRLKIDQSFISDIANDADDEAIVSAIIAMAHHLKIEVVAEGVETERQLEFLRLRGCDLIQGYLFSPPLPAEDVAPWYLEWQRRLPDRNRTSSLRAGAAQVAALPHSGASPIGRSHPQSVGARFAR